MITKELVKNLLTIIGNDGHCIYDPDILEGFPEEFRNRYNVIHESGDTYKSTIFTDDGVVDELEGVYGLDVLKDLCKELGLNFHRYRGRGTQARECTQVLVKWCDSVAV